jgi:uncharacterized protein
MPLTKPPKDPLEIIDRFLLSEHAPENSMGVSDIDGLFTGIVIGPEAIMPSEWLSVVWGGESPSFKNTKEAERITSALMEWYNEIVRGFQSVPPIFDPVFWETKDGIIIAADWAEGFNDAIKLKSKAWKLLFDDPSASGLLEAIQVLCGETANRLDANKEAELMREAADQLPDSVIGIHAFWQSRRR